MKLLGQPVKAQRSIATLSHGYSIAIPLSYMVQKTLLPTSSQVFGRRLGDNLCKQQGSRNIPGGRVEDVGREGTTWYLERGQREEEEA